MDFEEIYEAMQKCRKGVIWKDSAASFWLNGIERSIRLTDELNRGTYKAREPKSFKVYVPKERDIVSIAFRDRVYQRALNDNYIYPIMTKPFIKDNWACQKGKGTDGARDRLTEFLRSFYRHYGTEGYILKIDIKGYYPNMSHAVVEKLFRERLDPETYRRTENILREQYRGDTGYNPGSQLIQIAGISLLNKVDHYIKENLRIKYYLRYMDDFVLMHSDKKVLKECLDKIKIELGKIECRINEKKTLIAPIKEGITFLGFKYILTDTGKVVRLVDSNNIKRARSRLAHAVRKAKRGDMAKEKADEMFRSWIDHASKGNSYHLIQRMTKYYNDLWRCENEHCQPDQKSKDPQGNL